LRQYSCGKKSSNYQKALLKLLYEKAELKMLVKLTPGRRCAARGQHPEKLNKLGRSVSNLLELNCKSFVIEK
jgi:hypothetical protein